MDEGICVFPPWIILLEETLSFIDRCGHVIKMKGTSLLSCMKENLKDQWVTASKVRSYCSRAGKYVREVLEEAAKKGLIERKEEVKRKIYYRIDPPPGHSDPICPFEPYVSYEESICASFEEIIEDCVKSKHHRMHSESCNLLNHLERERSSQLTYTPLVSGSKSSSNFLRHGLEPFLYRCEPHNNVDPIPVV
jgi:hypothetical protein